MPHPLIGREVIVTLDIVFRREQQAAEAACFTAVKRKSPNPPTPCEKPFPAVILDWVDGKIWVIQPGAQVVCAHPGEWRFADPGQTEFCFKKLTP